MHLLEAHKETRLKVVSYGMYVEAVTICVRDLSDETHSLLKKRGSRGYRGRTEL